MRIEILRAFQHVACEDSAMGVMADERRLGGLVGTRERWAIIWALVYTCMYRKIHELGKQDRFQPVFRVCSLPPPWTLQKIYSDQPLKMKGMRNG